MLGVSVPLEILFSMLYDMDRCIYANTRELDSNLEMTREKASTTPSPALRPMNAPLLHYLSL